MNAQDELRSQLRVIEADLNVSAITLGQEGLRGACIEARNKLREIIAALAAPKGAGDALPWARFLSARADAIDWLHGNGETDSYIAHMLSMDETQVTLIRNRLAAPSKEAGAPDVWEYRHRVLTSMNWSEWSPLAERGDWRKFPAYTQFQYRTVAAPQADQQGSVTAWPRFVLDECLEVLRNVDTQFSATGQASARIARLINLLEGMKPSDQQGASLEGDAVVFMDAWQRCHAAEVRASEFSEAARRANVGYVYELNRATAAVKRAAAAEKLLGEVRRNPAFNALRSGLQHDIEAALASKASPDDVERSSYQRQEGGRCKECCGSPCECPSGWGPKPASPPTEAAAAVGENAPNCPRIENEQMVHLRWRDAQGLRCSTWRTAQEIGDMIAALSPTASAAREGL
jgi:hypothetical protein